MTSNPHALTGAWILGALDRAEHAEFEAHLTGCEDCRTEVASLEQAVVRLALTDIRLLFFFHRFDKRRPHRLSLCNIGLLNSNHILPKLTIEGTDIRFVLVNLRRDASIRGFQFA